MTLLEQAGKNQQQINYEMNPSEIINEEDVEESTGDQMSALKRMRRSQFGAVSSKDGKEMAVQLDLSASKQKKNGEPASSFNVTAMKIKMALSDRDKEPWSAQGSQRQLDPL